MGREKDVKTKIEEAALRLFVERGIAETSIQEIAHRRRGFPGRLV